MPTIGLTLNRYTAFLGDPNTNPLQKCYCSAPDKCMKKGVMNLFKCAGVPLVASHPHFYLADEDYLTMVDGLNPSKVRFFGFPSEYSKALNRRHFYAGSARYILGL
jgi:hypothetical protein